MQRKNLKDFLCNRDAPPTHQSMFVLEPTTGNHRKSINLIASAIPEALQRCKYFTKILQLSETVLVKKDGKKIALSILMLHPLWIKNLKLVLRFVWSVAFDN